MTEATTILQALNNIHAAMVMCCSGFEMDEDPAEGVPEASYKCKAAYVIYADVGEYLSNLAAMDGLIGVGFNKWWYQLWFSSYISDYLKGMSFTAYVRKMSELLLNWYWFTTDPQFNYFASAADMWLSYTYKDVIGILYESETPTEAIAYLEMRIAQCVAEPVANIPPTERALIQDLTTALFTYSFINRLFRVDPAIDALPEMNCEGT